MILQARCPLAVSIPVATIQVIALTEIEIRGTALLQYSQFTRSCDLSMVTPGKNKHGSSDHIIGITYRITSGSGKSQGSPGWYRCRLRYHCVRFATSHAWMKKTIKTGAV